MKFLRTISVSDTAFCGACIALIVLGGFRVRDYLHASPANPSFVTEKISNPTEVALGPLHVQGDKKAALVILEVSDFECPFCGRHFKETFADVKTQLIDKGEVRYGFVHYPLPMHTNARMAAAS